MLKKRGGRMHQWSTRYFILAGPKLSYKKKQDDTVLRGSFDLVPGCVVTEVIEESKKKFSFWVVWPHDRKNPKPEAEDSDDENVKEIDDDKTVITQHTSATSTPHAAGTKVKDLQRIVESEVMCQRRQKDAAEEQIEIHHNHDSNVSMGIKVAALAAGGVVVGALTAGIGLVPYITVVGITVAAGGGAAAMQWRRPFDSRIIIACESMVDALDWKTAIERQINRLEGSLKPMLPTSVDPKIISSILDKSVLGGAWKRVAIYEGMRIMEHISPGNLNICRGCSLFSLSNCPTDLNDLRLLRRKSYGRSPPLGERRRLCFRQVHAGGEQLCGWGSGGQCCYGQQMLQGEGNRCRLLL
jgi:hypothetical protein